MRSRSRTRGIFYFTERLSVFFQNREILLYSVTHLRCTNVRYFHIISFVFLVRSSAQCVKEKSISDIEKQSDSF